METKIYLKPISINDAFKGRRFKTALHKQYESDLRWYLCMPKIKRQKVSGWYSIKFKFYIKNYSMSDLSNLIKVTEDCIVKAGLVDDDRFCKKMELEKFKSDSDYFTFEINELRDSETTI